jgi:4-amino-4-deoxy-L-arabinose transferase-like glycosyltransferase
VTIAAYIAGLFVDVTRDASKYATISREVFESGDLIHLKIHGEPYDQKPPLLFWLSALGFYFMGLSNAAFKLPVLLIGLLGLYSTYRLGKSMHGSKVGWTAALVLVTIQASFLYFMDIHTDTLLQSWVVFSLWQLFEFIKNRRSFHCIMGFTGIGLAMLSKGPVGAVIPAFAVAGHLIFTRQYKRLFDYRWYAGTLLALVLVLPALAGLYKQYGWDGVLFYFWTNNAERLAGNLGSSRSDFFFFFHNLLLLFFPWMLILYTSVVFEFRSLLKRKFRAREYFIFSGIWVYFIILAISQGKLPNYIMVLLPLFAILTAKYITVALSGRKPQLYRLFHILQDIVLLLGIIICITVFGWFFPLSNIWQWVLCFIMVALIVYVRLISCVPQLRLLVPTIAMVGTLNFFLHQHVAPQIFGDQASVKAAALFNEQAGTYDRLYNYNYDSYELFFYANCPVTRIYNDVTVISLLQEPGSWIFTERKVVERLEGNYPEPQVIPIEHVWINNLNIKYLIPNTRPQSRDTLFLLRSTAH